MKVNVFLSVAGTNGIQEAGLLKIKLEAIESYNGLKFACYLYTDEQFNGGFIHDYFEHIYTCNFFVPVITPEYCEPTRSHIKKELESAFLREDSITFSSKGRYRFIFPFIPKDADRLIGRVPRLDGRKCTSDVNELANAMVINSPFALLYKGEPFGFDIDWPGKFFTPDGEPDILMVLGHSGKEKPPTKSELPNLNPCTIEEDLPDRYKSGTIGMPRQSMRVAEYVPRLVQFLSNEYLGLRPGQRSVPLIGADIDWHLIKYRYDLLKAHNLICFGAGDTNWISRAVLTYYSTLLPVVFDTPGGSHAIHLRTTVDPNSGLQKDDLTGKIELAKYDRAWMSEEANDAYFSAVLLLLPNPWNIDKKVIIAAGLTALGSQASILALCDSRITEKQVEGMPWARVIRGIEGEGRQQWQAVNFAVVT